MFETIGVFWLETLGAYLVGRCFVRTASDFFGISRLLFLISILFLPFALYEMKTGTSLLLEAFGNIGPVYDKVSKEPRLGLQRVQGPFVHQIHFGVFFGALVGLAYFVIGYGKTWIGRVVRATICAFLCFSALSSGPLAAATAQIYFLVWDGSLGKVKSRWKILGGLSIFAYVIIDVISNRTPFHVFISYFAFSENTAYNRIRIWTYGTQSIWENPLFGIGLYENWVRPWYMSPSVDMFWILPAMRHGVLVWVLWICVFLWVFLKVANRTDLSERIEWYKMGYLCSMSGLFIAGWTVHYWDGLYVFFLFLLGSGVWILDWQGDAEGNCVSSDKELEVRGLPYSRFPAKVR